MSDARVRREGQLLGALSLAVADELRAAVEGASGQVAAAPAALVALHDLLDGRSVDRLRRAVGLTPSGGVRLVDRLVADGYVERRPGPDARTLAVALTPAGRRAARQVLAARAAAVEAVLEPLDDDERATLERLHEKLIAGLTRRRLGERRRGERGDAAWMCRLCDTQACGRPHGECPAARVTGAGGPAPTAPSAAPPGSPGRSPRAR